MLVRSKKNTRKQNTHKKVNCYREIRKAKKNKFVTHSQQTQNIPFKFIQCWSNAEDVDGRCINVIQMFCVCWLVKKSEIVINKWVIFLIAEISLFKIIIF